MIRFFRNKPKIAVLLSVGFLAAISFNVAFDYNFWRDDWKVIWMARNYPLAFIRYVFPSHHPGEIVNSIPLVFVLGDNRPLWQISGFLIKILASFSVGLATYGLTESKKSFVLASVLFASFFGGAEAYTWMSARLSAFITILLTLGIYFFTSSYYERKNLKYFVSLLIIYLSLAIEPGRAIFLGGFLLFWEFTTRFLNRDIFTKSFLNRTLGVFSFTILGLLSTNLGRGLLLRVNSGTYSTFGKGSSGYIERLWIHKDQWLSVFNSIGNLIAPYFRKVYVIGGLATTKSSFNAYMGLMFLLVIFIAGLYFLFRKRKSAPIFLLVPLWILAFYLPSWIFEPGLVVGASHRYLAVSSAGFIIFISYLLTRLSRKKMYLILTILLLVNLFWSYRLNLKDYEIRGYNVTQPLYESQAASVPPGHTNGVFFVTGDHYLRGYGFDWAAQGRIPFALERGIEKVENLPLQGIRYGDVAKKVCEGGFQEEILGYEYNILDPISIEKIYGWQVNEFGHLENATNLTRVKVAQEAECLRKEQNIRISQGLNLVSTVYLDQLYKPGDAVVAFRWIAADTAHNLLVVDVNLFDKNGRQLVQDTFDLDLPTQQKTAKTFDKPLYFNEILGEPFFAQVTMRGCKEECEIVAREYLTL